jgi:hypothetical protein
MTIDGQSVAGDTTVGVVNPSTGAAFTELQTVNIAKL